MHTHNIYKTAIKDFPSSKYIAIYSNVQLPVWSLSKCSDAILLTTCVAQACLAK